MISNKQLKTPMTYCSQNVTQSKANDQIRFQLEAETPLSQSARLPLLSYAH